MTIVCLGWGSLIWHPANLACDPKWREDGPALPIEFARVSSGDRITLVIVDGVQRSPVLWSPLEVESLDEAVAMLAAREDTDAGDIGRWPAPGGAAYPLDEVIAAWAKGKQVDGVVWAALRPGFPNRRGTVPKLDDLLKHAAGLTGQKRKDATEYVEKAPKQIRTANRPALEKVLEVAAEELPPVAFSIPGDTDFPSERLRSAAR